MARPGPFVALAFLLTAYSAHARTLRGAGAPKSEPGGAASAPGVEGVSPAGASPCCARLEAIGFSSELPVVVIDAPPGSLAVKGNDSNVRVCTCSAASAAWSDFDAAALAGVRGSTSANATKKSFDLKLRSPANASASVSFPFLGMPEESGWILYGGDEVDLTQGLRNYMAYNLARAAGQYASRTVYVEVFLVNDTKPLGPQHYHGIYIAEESIKRGSGRVDVKKLAPPNLSGGFIFVFDNDNIDGTDFTFGPTKHLEFPFVLKYPAKDDPNARAATDWLLAFINKYEDALFAPGRTGNSSYTSFIDGPSFLDYFLHTEVTKNPDGYRGSTYLHKDRDAPLAMGPAWDYNEAFGLCCGYPIDGWQHGGQSGPGVAGGSAISPEGWRFLICADPERCLVEPGDGTSTWYRRMWQDPRFRSAAAQRWAALRAGNWSDAAVTGLLDGAAAKIRPAALRNYERYTWVLERSWYPDGAAQFDGEVATLRSWLLARLAWLDKALAGAATAPAVEAGAATAMAPAPEAVRVKAAGQQGS